MYQGCLQSLLSRIVGVDSDNIAGSDVEIMLPGTGTKHRNLEKNCDKPSDKVHVTPMCTCIHDSSRLCLYGWGFTCMSVLITAELY